MYHSTASHGCPIPNFIQIGQEIWKVWTEIRIWRETQYEDHRDNFHENHVCLSRFDTKLCRISWKSVERFVVGAWSWADGRITWSLHNDLFAIISLYNINWLVFITEIECVYCAVRTGYLNTLRFSLSIYGAEQCKCVMTAKQPFVTCGLWRRPVSSTYCCIMTLPHKTTGSLLITS
jgi:hypothetical protein